MITRLFDFSLKFIRHPALAHLIFWLWNGTFLSLIGFGFIPYLLVPMYKEAREGTLPLSFFFTVLGVIAVPIAATAIGAIFFRKRPDALRSFFFAVEAPLFLLGVARLFLMRELTPATRYVLLIFAMAAVLYLIELFRTSSSPFIRLVFGTVCGTAGAYLAILLSFYVVPLVLGVWYGIADFDNWISAVRAPFQSLFALFFSTFAVASFAVFAALPLALIALYGSRFVSAFRAFTARTSRASACAVSALILFALAAQFVRSNRQPQVETFALFAEQPATDAARIELLKQSPQIREGLLNAYLAQYRYVAELGGRQGHLINLWVNTGHVQEDTAVFVQSIFEHFAQPWLYDGKESSALAAELYAHFFDAPIQKAEKAAILHALETTWDRAQREAGLLDEGQRRVHVARQELAITERGDYADVELHELYQNKTPEQQEIFYTFSLPESAAITALYLGDTAERERRFPFVLAPRGAAQSVYKAEVARRVDPALLEQIGPRQYRLRAFPIPPKGSLHLWLEYQVMIDDGTIPLPLLAERRNVYLDQSTERLARAMPLAIDSADAWLPRSLPALAAAPSTAHTVKLSPTMTVRAEPVELARFVPAPGKKYAIVLDRSRSMGAHVAELSRSFEWLREQIMPSSDVDLYLTACLGRNEPPMLLEDPSAFDPSRVVFFNAGDAHLMLSQFYQLGYERTYDAVIVLTDATSSEQSKDGAVLPITAPVHFVHLGGALPPGYDDGTLELIQSTGGGVHLDIRRAFAAVTFAARTDPTQLALADGYLYRSIPSTEATDDETRFAPIAARQLIRSEAAVLRDSSANRLETLDRIHNFAKRHSVVTPYSSMLVLVNDEQRARLAAAEKAQDRFDREVENGEEALTKPHGGFSSVTATPEPHEWALFFVAIGFMIVSRLRSRSTFGTKSPQYYRAT